MLSVYVLGQLSIEVDGVPAVLPSSKKTRALLGYLAVTARGHSRDRLIALLFDGTDDPRQNLRGSLSKIRSVVGDVLVAQQDHVSLALPPDALDLRRLRAAATSGSAGELARVVAGLREGSLLAGLDGLDSAELDLWLTEARADANTLVLRALKRLTAELPPQDALTFARSRVRVDPRNETAHARLLELLVSLGRTDEAEAQYDVSHRQLRAAHPGRFLAELEHARRRPSLQSQGEIPRTPNTPDPPKLTPLAGRQAELEQIRAWVTSPTSTVCEISGAAGMGRTRLLQETRQVFANNGGRTSWAVAHKTERVRELGVFRELMASIPEVGRDTLDDVAVIESLGELSAFRPLGLFVDDLQWIDPYSAALLHALVRAERVAVAWSIERPVLEGSGAELSRALRRRVCAIELGPLRADDVRSLAESIGAESEVDEVIAKSEGRPALAVSLARAKAVKPWSGTADELGERSVEVLEPEVRELAGVAAAIGRRFDLAALAAVTGHAPFRLASVLGVLMSRGIITAEGEGYVFSHELVRYTAYRLLPGPTQRLVGEAIAALERHSEPKL